MLCVHVRDNVVVGGGGGGQCLSSFERVFLLLMPVTIGKVWNVLLPTLSRYLVVHFESHETIDALDQSFIAKAVTARTFCSSLVLYALGVAHSSQILSPYYVGTGKKYINIFSNKIQQI